MSRRQLLATRHPETGAVMLPQQTESATRCNYDVFVFEPVTPRNKENDDVDYARPTPEGGAGKNGNGHDAEGEFALAAGRSAERGP